MRRLAFAVLAVFAAALPSVALPTAASQAAAADAPPWRTMRNLQNLEDRVAAGDALAQAARAKAVPRLAATFAALPLETWRDARNARALVAYLFGGGDAAAIVAAVPVEAVAKDVQPLYRGAIAYGTGDDEGARAALTPLEARSLPSGIAGHLALVQAALVEPTDRPRAMALLDLARLLEPGTLVEEAALRKEMALLGDASDADKVGLVGRRYVAAFSRSVYAENFRQLVAGLALKAAATNDVAGNERLSRLVVAFARDDRRRMLLAIAREQVVAGRCVSAIYAANEAARLADPAGRDAARAAVYFGAAALVGPTYDKARASLEGADPQKLDDADRNLRTAALELAATLRATAGAAAAPEGAQEAAVLRRGAQALKVADTTLAGPRP